MKFKLFLAYICSASLGQEDFVFNDIANDLPVSEPNTEGKNEDAPPELVEENRIEDCNNFSTTENIIKDYSKTLGQCCSLNIHC